MRNTFLAFTAASLLPAAAAFAQTYDYALIPILSLDGSQNLWISDINDSGEISGSFFVVGQTESKHAYRWHEGATFDLGTRSNSQAEPAEMNSYGDIVGSCSGSDRDNFSRATIWTRDGHVMPLDTDLGYSPRIHPTGINDSGLVTGMTVTTEGPPWSTACTWSDGVRTPLERLGPDLSAAAFDLNNKNEIVGYVGDSDHVRHAALWKDGKLTVLPGLGGLISRATLVNEKSVIAGSAQDAAGESHAVLWRDGQLEFIADGLPPHQLLSVNDLNDFEEIVGRMFYAPQGYVGIIRREGAWYMLNDLLPPNTDFNIRNGIAINNLGMVGVGEADEFFELDRGALLMPVNPTLSLSDPGPGIAGRVNTLTLTGATPNARIYFYYGLRGGGQVIPGCPVADLVALQIAAPIQAGSVRADASGTAVITGFVPDSARRADLVLLQCAVPSECRISQLVAFKFQ